VCTYYMYLYTRIPNEITIGLRSWWTKMPIWRVRGWGALVSTFSPGNTNPVCMIRGCGGCGWTFRGHCGLWMEVKQQVRFYQRCWWGCSWESTCRSTTTVLELKAKVTSLVFGHPQDQFMNITITLLFVYLLACMKN